MQTPEQAKRAEYMRKWRAASPAQQERERQMRAANPERYRAYRRKEYAKTKAADPVGYNAKHRERQARYIAKNREKQRAYGRVYYALKTGKLLREPCERCGAADVHAHHDDYSKPLDVRWLCTPCHELHHHPTGT